MKLSAQTRININKVVFITAVFIVLNVFIAIFSHAIITSPYSLGPSPEYNLWNAIKLNIYIGLFAGILGGTLLVYVNSKLLRKKTFRYAMTTTALAYTLIFIVITTITIIDTTIISFNEQSSFKEGLIQTFTIITSPVIFVYFAMWGAITLLTLFVLQVSDKFGQGTLLKFILGKYHHPKMEKRIFMFLDMRSSTTIAEKIGNEKYFNLLNDIFSDITDTIINNNGEIYQYVGDEIVLTWPIIKGKSRGDFINCYFEIKQRLIDLGSIYNSRYGIIPEMKAGIHFGPVMAGEIGVVKKDIIYSGDVLNTTARIQESCNKYEVDILLSKRTFQFVENPKKYKLIQLGIIELRGKERKIELNTINRLR